MSRASLGRSVLSLRLDYRRGVTLSPLLTRGEGQWVYFFAFTQPRPAMQLI